MNLADEWRSCPPVARLPGRPGRPPRPWGFDVRGDWGASDWRGWWGDEPPYHAPVFVLTHHPREPISMAGGTTFSFVGDFDSAVKQAVAAAGDKTVTIA